MYAIINVVIFQQQNNKNIFDLDNPVKTSFSTLRSDY